MRLRLIISAVTCSHILFHLGTSLAKHLLLHPGEVRVLLALLLANFLLLCLSCQFRAMKASQGRGQGPLDRDIVQVRLGCNFRAFEAERFAIYLSYKLVAGLAC